MPEFLNIELMNWEDFWDLVIRASFNLFVVLILVSSPAMPDAERQSVFMVNDTMYAEGTSNGSCINSC